MEEAEEKLKQAFSRVKKDFESINEKIEKLEVRLDTQTSKINEIWPKINEILEEIKSKNKEFPEENFSDQALKRLSERASERASERLSASKFKQENGVLKLINDNYDTSTGNEGAKRLSASLSDQASTKRALSERASERLSASLSDQKTTANQHLDKDLEELKQKLDSIFFKLSKQELKLFLLIYQLGDDEIPSTTKTLSSKMQLSESCVRAYLSSLFNKKVPIEKFRVNNKTNIWVIKKDFKALNLKRRLIDLFYYGDSQKTLLNF